MHPGWRMPATCAPPQGGTDAMAAAASAAEAAAEAAAKLAGGVGEYVRTAGVNLFEQPAGWGIEDVLRRQGG